MIVALWIIAALLLLIAIQLGAILLRLTLMLNEQRSIGQTVFTNFNLGGKPLLSEIAGATGVTAKESRRLREIIATDKTGNSY